MDWLHIMGAVELLYADVLLVILVATYLVTSSVGGLRNYAKWLLNLARHGTLRPSL